MVNQGTHTSFDRLMSRADDVVLQELVGADVIRLLRSIDPELASPSRLRSLVTEYRDPAELLRDPNTRTLLLELLPVGTIQNLLERLGVESRGEPFTAISGLSAVKGSAREEQLFSFFGLQVPSEGDVYQPAEHSSTLGGYPLFRHQRDAASRVQKILTSDSRRVLLHMPTGAGKTRTAMNIIADHLRESEPSLVVWLAFSEELCEQAIEEFEQAWSFLGNRPIDVLRFWGTNNPEIKSVSDGLIVAGLGKMYNYAMSSIASMATLADRTSLVVIDEAHQSVAPTYQFVLDSLVEKQLTTALVGLSATPGRTWNEVDQDQKLADFFRRQKVGLEVEGFANPVEYLVEEGYLARPVFSTLFYNSGEDLSSRDLAEIEASLDISVSLLERLAEDEQRNLRIIQRTEEVARHHQRIIIFAASVRHAKLLTAVLRSRNITADAITADTPHRERQRIINKYRGSLPEPIVLCNFGVLTAGFDAPSTSAAIIARPTKSLVLYSQMIGRALRGPLAKGNEEAEIITVVDTNLPGFGNLAESFFNWEDVWT